MKPEFYFKRKIHIEPKLSKYFILKIEFLINACKEYKFDICLTTPSKIL
ncbi:hypothetical protein SAMN05216273_10541 [Chryseobacterium taihuense]|uniref:Uncharacterized protein n=1 Tax=Chryseobacterium taihuense TaxID=1141221 RepID=A0ABY0QS82_9FLAO|nr:hypothetical protein SAMN05216273_10541 [Chryseobacterium taihuense]